MKPCIEEDTLVVNKKVFGDKNEHSYTMTCYDGVAYGKANDPNEKVKEIRMTYPLLRNLTNVDKDNIREYRGFDPSEKINFGDVMMAKGNIYYPHKLTSNERNYAKQIKEHLTNFGYTFDEINDIPIGGIWAVNVFKEGKLMQKVALCYQFPRYRFDVYGILSHDAGCYYVKVTNTDKCSWDETCTYGSISVYLQ